MVLSKFGERAANEAANFIELGTKNKLLPSDTKKELYRSLTQDPSSTTLLYSPRLFLSQKDAQKALEVADMNPTASDPKISAHAGDISQQEADLGILPSHGNLIPSTPC